MLKALLTACLMVVCASPAFSQMGMNERKDGHGHMMEIGSMDRMGDMMGMCLENADKIGLSEDQVAKITPLHREMKKKQVRYNADIKIAEMDLREIMEVKDFDLEKANAAVKKIEDIKSAYHMEMLKRMKEVRSALTEEQFKKMKTMMHMKIDGKKPGMDMDDMKMEMMDKKMDEMRKEMMEKHDH
jgi:periplasmic protein CpxP/Spy